MAAFTEQETTVTFNRGDSVAYVWSNIPHHIEAMGKDDRFVPTGDDTWVIAGGDFHPLRGLKRRMTEEQRAALVERGKRLAASRA